MQSFTFNSVTRIVFGRGTFAQIGEIAAEFGSRLLIVRHGGADRHGLIGRLKELLSAKKVAFAESPLDGEPSVADVDRGLAVARAEKCDAVIGIGGGSAIDCAKAIAGLLTNGGGALDYMEVIGKGLKIAKPAAPWIAIPTTAGTGAEVTRNAVIGAPEHRFKASLRSEHLLARVALVDPELHVNVRPEVTARTGMDALTQCIEAYTSKNANEISDALALRGVELASRSLVAAYKDGSNLKAREDMAMSALISGITLTNAGLGAVHGFAAPMGARYPIPHGTVCAILLPHCTRANIAALKRIRDDHPALMKYLDLSWVHLSDPKPKTGTTYDHVVPALEAFSLELNIPRLRDYGVKEEHIPELVAAAKKANSMKTNPAELSDEELAGILRAAI